MSQHLTPDGAVTPAFARMMVALAETLGAKLAETRIRLYASLLGDLPVEALQPAFRQAATEQASGFFPSPGELRRYLSPSVDDRALLSWAVLNQAASAIGGYASVEIEDGAAAQALVAAFGSWAAFCAMEEGPALTLRRQEYLAAYRQAARDQPPVTWLPGLLPGPPQAVAARLWSGRVTSNGRICVEPSRKALPEGTSDWQGTDTQAREDQRSQAGATGDPDSTAEGSGSGRVLPAAGRADDGAVPGAERVGAPTEPPPVENARPGAGGAAHDGREPDVVRRPPRRAGRAPDVGQGND